MADNINSGDPGVTSRLLAELNLVMNQSDLVRAIVSKCENVRKIETASGPSRRTRLLRQEITELEIRLKDSRKSKFLINQGYSYSS